VLPSNKYTGLLRFSQIGFCAKSGGICEDFLGGFELILSFFSFLETILMTKLLFCWAICEDEALRLNQTSWRTFLWQAKWWEEVTRHVCGARWIERVPGRHSVPPWRPYVCLESLFACDLMHERLACRTHVGNNI